MSQEKTNLRQIIRNAQKSRQLVLDYALGSSILGLIPIEGLSTLKLMIAIALIAKMLWDLGGIWRFSRGQDGLAIAGYVLGWVGGIIMTILIWLIVFALGIYIPYVRRFAIAVSLFTCVWIIGQATNHFYQIGQLKEHYQESKL